MSPRASWLAPIAALWLGATPAASEPRHAEHPGHAAAELGGVLEVEHAVRIGTWHGTPHYRTRLVSPPHRIDRIYHSMQGPMRQSGFRLDPGAGRELLWLTGYEAVVVDTEAAGALPQEFMCHSTVAVNAGHYDRLLPTRLGVKEGRIFTLAQGQQRVRFPEGVAVPFLSDQRLELQSQVLNHNLPDAKLDVRMRIAIEFVRDRELGRAVIPLALTGASGLKLVEGEVGYFGLAPEEVDAERHGLGCSIGVPAKDGHEVRDAFGRRFTPHWIVAPGRERNTTRVTDQLAISYDTRIHYAAAHMHPFGQSLALRDLTTGEVVLELRGRSARDRIALEEVAFAASAEGIPIFADHEYELESVYDNPTDVDQDAMATLYLYVGVEDVEVGAIRARASALRRR